MEKQSISTHLACMLPSQSEIHDLIPTLGSGEHETLGDVKHADAIKWIVAELVASPHDHLKWQELAKAFLCEARWKYLYIAHSLCPSDAGILHDLAWVCVSLGDFGQALIYIDQAIALANREHLESMFDSKFQILIQQIAKSRVLVESKALWNQ